MRPPAAIAVDFEREPRSSSDYEEIQAQELPLHYMNEDKARRRVPKGPSSIGYPSTDDIAARDAYDDDEGKDVYNKARPIPRLSSGRNRPIHQPPATSIVRGLTPSN